MHKFLFTSTVLIGFLGFFSLSPTMASQQDSETLIGVPVIQDSGTLRINGQEINLWGIRPLAPDQQCWEKSASWGCGEAATMALRHFIHGSKLKCTIIKKGTEGNSPQATCMQKGMFHKKDIAHFLVVKGFALDASGAYKIQQMKAKKKKRGIWSGRFQTAQDWKDGIQKFMGSK